MLKVDVNEESDTIEIRLGDYSSVLKNYSELSNEQIARTLERLTNFYTKREDNYYELLIKHSEYVLEKEKK